MEFAYNIYLPNFLLPIPRGLESDARMEIFIQHQGQQTGPFSPQEIQAGLSSGAYQSSDLVWTEGMAGWLPLSASPHLLGGSPPLPDGAPPQNSGLAITSMVLGISALLCGITAIPAVICGHISLGKIKQSQGRISGGGFAITGLITGYLGFVVIIIAFLAGLTAPMVIRQRKKADQTEAMSNARQIGLALFEFESEYGSYPNLITAPQVAKVSSNPEIIGTSSNARFRQLFQAGITQSEQMFYAKSSGTHKADGDISGDNALASGECGFGYVENIRTDDNTPRPLVMAPFLPGGTEFDTTPFDHKAIILWSDNSVTSLPIDRSTGEVILDSQNLLDPSHPIWGGTPPSLLLPK